jgi:exopolyphosphatase / guanosine-5'-triphosphate,3'-diphosphate pyrophosphatase
MVKEIVPRWEWRTFGEGFNQSDSRFAAFASSGVLESDEIYFFSPASDGNVKVRDGLMDIKLLQQVNSDGLEQWRPVLKASFPLDLSAVAQVFESLGIASPELTGSSFTLEQIAQMFIDTHCIQTLKIHKTRARYIIDTCPAEITEVRAGSRRTATVAVESEDPARVIGVVRKLGLADLENVSYPRGLKQLLGMAQGASACSDTR